VIDATKARAVARQFSIFNCRLPILFCNRKSKIYNS